MGFGVQNTIQPNDFQKKTIGSIEGTAQRAEAEKEAKEEAYATAMNQLSAFETVRTKAYKNLQSLKANYKNGYTSNLTTAQYEYNMACNNYSEANINSDVLRSSLMDSIFYAGKMNNSATLAKSTLA